MRIDEYENRGNSLGDGEIFLPQADSNINKRMTKEVFVNNEFIVKNGRY